MTEKKQKTKIKKFKIWNFIILIFLVIYLPSFFIWLFGDNIKTALIIQGQIEESINTEGYFIRNEKLLTSSISGKLIASINEGERVQANSIVASTLKPSADRIIKELKNIDLDIIRIQSSKQDNQITFLDDLKKIDEEIQNNVRIMIKEEELNSIIKIRNLESKVDELIAKKTEIIGNCGTNDTYLNKLKEKKISLKEELKLNTNQIFSDASGIVSYSIDGYENALNVSSIKTLNLSFLKKLQTGKVVRDLDDIDINAGKPFAKLIKDFEYYIVVALKDKEANRLQIDNNIKVRIHQADKIIKGIVKYKFKDKDNNFIVAVKTDEAMESTAAIRTANIDLIFGLYEGLKVPRESLLNMNKNHSKAKIAILKSGKVRFTDANIKGINNDFAILENKDIMLGEVINLYDKFVINPKNIKEGQVVAR